MKIELYVLEKDGRGHIIINKAKAEGFFIKREGFKDVNPRCAHGIRSRTLNEPRRIGYCITSTNLGVRSFF